MFILRFSHAEKCLNYFLNCGNRNLLNSTTYQILREVQKSINSDHKTETLGAISEQKTNNKSGFLLDLNNNNFCSKCERVCFDLCF